MPSKVDRVVADLRISTSVFVKNNEKLKILFVLYMENDFMIVQPYLLLCPPRFSSLECEACSVAGTGVHDYGMIGTG